MKARILVVDDEAEIRRSVRMILEYEGYDVQEASSGPEALAIIERETPDLVFLDIKMSGMDGLDALQRIRQTNESLPVVIISGHGTVSTAVEATKLGAFDFIEKPLASERVLVTIRNALDQTRLQNENRTLKRAVEVRHQMVGESPALRHIWDAIKRAAPTNATVLLLGESGAGKELVARSIHRNSLRSRERFVQVNCAAIPEELIESELFGHEKGSFTGATEKQIGKFEQADRGTIFLDEVGDMSPKTQAKVLRVLQEGEVERLGSARTIKVDVRVIAATNKDLEGEIEKGTFREDLYFRLSVIPIRVPPLRDRREDIPALVRHFVDLFSRENNRRPQRFTPAALEYMQKARWKGNVRELRNTVERLLIMTPGDNIDIDDLKDVVRMDTAKPAVIGEAAPAGGQPIAPGTLREFKESAERKFLVEKLRENAWNISKTAEGIGTPRSNLYKKLEQYAITQESDGQVKASQSAVSRILSTLAPLAQREGVTIIPLAPSLLTGSSSLPGDSLTGPVNRPRACARGRGLPIWPCSVRGFACHRCCHRRGALLPHLFTLTRLPPLRGLRRGRPCHLDEACLDEAREASEVRRYIFCATFLRVAPTGRYPAHCPAEF